MIGCLRTRVRKQQIIVLYFEFENKLKFYNHRAWTGHNHRPQTNPRHHEEETQNIDSHNRIKVKQTALFFSARDDSICLPFNNYEQGLSMKKVFKVIRVQ